jgi:Flp pilus assembly protein TadG
VPLARHPTRGSVSIEAVLIVPAFLLFLLLVLAIGRTASAQADVHAAVVQAARVVSLQDNADAGQAAGRQAIHDSLLAGKVICQSIDITIESAALDLPPGEPGEVSAAVTCRVALADLSVPGLPGQVTIAEDFATPINTYESRPR